MHQNQQKTRPLQISNLGELGAFLRRNTKPVFLLIALSLLVYINILSSEFVFDDISAYVESPLVRDLAGSIKTFNMQSIYYGVFYKFFQLNPTPFHAVSLLLHVSCVLLLFVLTTMLFDKKIALIAAALFSVHPVNSEVVNWISAISYLINFAFIFLVAIFYVIYFNSHKTLYLSISLVLYFFGLILGNSPIILTVLPIIFVLDQFILQNHFNFWTQPFIKKYLGFVLISVIILFTSVLPSYERRINTYSTTLQFEYDTALGLEKRIPLTLAKSAVLLSFPKNLSVYHFGNQSQIDDEQFYAANLFTLLAFVVILITYKLNKRGFGLLFLLVASLLPFLTPVQVSMIIAERYLYIGAAFFSILVSLLLYKIEGVTKIKNLAVGIAIILIILFSVRTVIRNMDWYTQESFWRAEIRLNPNIAAPYTFLGNIFAQEKRYQEAIDMYKESFEISPNLAHPLIGAGNVYAEVGKFVLAEEFYLAAIEANPYLPITYYNLALVKLTTGNRDEAVTYLDKALSVDPNYYPASQTLENIQRTN